MDTCTHAIQRSRIGPRGRHDTGRRWQCEDCYAIVHDDW